MNYYYPYMNIPNSSVGILSKIFKNGINWSTILTNTQKTLNIVNQTIPLIKQAGPVINNTKTMFKIMNEFKKVETPQNNIKKSNKEINEPTNTPTNNNNPTFFQ